MKGDQDWVQTPPQDFRSSCYRDTEIVIFLDYQELGTPSLQNRIYCWPPEYFIMFNLQFWILSEQISIQSIFGQSWLGIVFNDFQDFSLRFRFHQEFMRFFSIPLFRHDLLFSILISYSENHIRLFVDCVFSLTGSYIAILTFHTKYRQEYLRAEALLPYGIWYPEFPLQILSLDIDNPNICKTVTHIQYKFIIFCLLGWFVDVMVWR